jgi:hypothetical protein
MAVSLGSYSFLPWLRQGIASKLTAQDGDSQVKLRASIPVTIEVGGDGLAGGPLTQNVSKDVQLFGPGDVIGIDARAIVRVDPRDWITSFEPNYLPCIEFYDEDFPWRYTPAAPENHRLRPWIALVVLEEGEFEEGTDLSGKPLPYVTVSDRDLFPPADQLWAWAHVHVNRGLTATEADITSGDMNAALPRLSAMLSEDPDLAYSRILAPRRLRENVAYHAFLMPVFESGRLAGLGLDPSRAPHATHGAWQDYPQKAGDRLHPDEYPVYHRWYFRAGAVGDFEYLVRLLQAWPLDSRVGWRDVDVQSPGSHLPGITDPALGGVLKLSGALRVPPASLTPEERARVEAYDRWAVPDPHPFQLALAAFINLADDYRARPAAQANAAVRAALPATGGGLAPVDPDPLITPPLYGRWHALTERVLTGADGAPLPDRTNWVHTLNLDPRYRAVAGFGTAVIQKWQEDYMNLAWAQIGDVLEAIRRIRAAHLAREVSVVWYERELKSAEVGRSLMLTAPLHSRVVVDGKTVHYQVAGSRLSASATSAAMRRAIRPQGRLMRSLPFTPTTPPGALLRRMNRGEVAAARPKRTPAAVTTIESLAAALLPRGLPGFLVAWLRRWPRLAAAALILGLVVAVVLAVLLSVLVSINLGIALGAAVAALAAGAARLVARWHTRVSHADRLSGPAQAPESVDRLPASAGFVLRPPQAGNPAAARGGSADSPEAIRFKQALRNSYTLLADSSRTSAEAAPIPLDLQTIGRATLTTIDPERTIARRFWDGVHVPGAIADLQAEEFREPLFYPEINLPMYKPLYELSPELLIPNVNLVPENSITLLETNRNVIEAYMVGLNHEFGRELLWREYPSDNRGSYFRQFWDVSAYLGSAPASDAAARERLKDIPPLHLWSKRSRLGTHDNRVARSPGEEDTVLVIRGELLKRYPTAVIYAQRAAWAMKDGQIDSSQPRTLVPVTEAELDAAPRDRIRTPLYQAKLEPDIYFLGFDLTVEQARGGTGAHRGDDPGWFFILKECPGEPRFGLDLSRDGPIAVWNDLTWADVAAEDEFLRVDPPALPVLTEPPAAASEVHDQWADDRAVRWDANVTSADLAYILFQAPVLVAIHAGEFLRDSLTGGPRS